MEATWFFLLTFMLIVYVVLDGFDFGAGILHLVVARTDDERRTVLAAIGPVWDGNEVWLVAFGGVLVFSFPRVYAIAFSGFYLPFMMVLWLLVIRGISIEFRSQQPNPLWRAFWDAAFSLASAVLTIVLGVALGNVVRGVPIDASGYFRGPLFGDFQVASASGAIDWYTLVIGLFALLTLSGHGLLYLQWKTSGSVHLRCRRAADRVWLLIALSSVPTTLATASVRPEIFRNLLSRSPMWVFPFLIVGCLVALFTALRRENELAAFLASSGFIASMLGATAGALFPTMLHSTIDASLDLTAYNSSSGKEGLAIGLSWWIPAIVLAIGYFAYVFRSFRGKVAPTHDDHG